MADWEFCKVERETIGPADQPKSSSGGQSRGQGGGHGGEKFTDRVYMFRMTAQHLTPDGLEKIMETEPYRGFLRDDPLHNQWGEKLLALLGQQGWEPFFTDTRSSPDYFSWHLKRLKPE